MKCSVCKKNNILETICQKKYNFMLYPFSKPFKCDNCETRYDILFLISTPHKIIYLTTKSSPVILG